MIEAHVFYILNVFLYNEQWSDAGGQAFDVEPHAVDGAK